MSLLKAHTPQRGARLLSAPLVLGAFVAFTGGVLATLLLEFAALAQIRTPWHSLETDYFTGVIGAAVITGVLAVLPVGNREKKALVVAWCFKAAVALGPMLAYEAYYDFLDAYSYHEGARAGIFTLSEYSWGDGTALVTLILQGLYYLLPPSYHLSKIIFSFVGLIGLYLAYRGAAEAWKFHSLTPFYVLAFFPRLLFWSSILGKEPLMIFSMGLYIYGLGRMIGSNSYSGILFVILAIALASGLRPWMAPILLAPLPVATRFRGKKTITYLVTILLILLVAAFFALRLFERFGVSDPSSFVLTIHNLSRAWAVGGSAQEPQEFHSLLDMLKFVPIGSFTALFRPLPGEVGGIFGIAASIENVFLLSFVTLALYRVRYVRWKDSLFLSLIILIVLWALVYGFISYQNLGTAVRYKAVILPLLLLACAYLWLSSRPGRGNRRTLLRAKD